MHYSQPEEMSEYVIVEFYEEKQNDSCPVSIISSDWIFETKGVLKCYWPTYFYKDKQREIAVKEHQEIDKDKSLICSIRVKYNTDDYEKAEEKLIEIEEELASSSAVSDADVPSQDNVEVLEKRIVKKKRYQDFYSGHSSDDMEYQIPPAPKIKKDNKFSQEIRKSPRRQGQQLLGSRLGVITELPKPRPNLTRQLFNSQSPSTSKQVVLSQSTENEENSQGKIAITPNIPVTINAKEIIEKLQTNEGILKDILRRVQRLELNVTNLCARSQNAPVAEINDIFEIQTLSNLEELEEFERKLLDMPFFSKIVNSLGILGGKNTEEVCRNILARLLSKNLSLQLNWTGRLQKAQFSKYLNINKAILVAVRKNRASQNASQTEVEKATKVWLRNAYDRGGGRGQRGRVA